MRFSASIIFHRVFFIGKGVAWHGSHTLRSIMPFLTHNQITLRIQFGKNNANIYGSQSSGANGNQNFNLNRRWRENSSKLRKIERRRRGTWSTWSANACYRVSHLYVTFANSICRLFIYKHFLLAPFVSTGGRFSNSIWHKEEVTYPHEVYSKKLAFGSEILELIRWDRSSKLELLSLSSGKWYRSIEFPFRAAFKATLKCSMGPFFWQLKRRWVGQLNTRTCLENNSLK